jgi:hypothetical protein
MALQTLRHPCPTKSRLQQTFDPSWLLAGKPARFWRSSLLATCALLCHQQAGLPVLWAAPVGAYDDYDALSQGLSALAAEYPDACELFSIGSSRQGRELWSLRLARGDDPPVPARRELARDRAAIAIVAGTDGDYPVTSAVAVRIARSLLGSAEGEPGWKLLGEHTVYVIPRVNPDAMESYFASPRVQQRLTLRPTDNDRDGIADEDGPEDLNADGLITLMRVPLADRPISDLEPTHILDPDEPRLLKKADRAKGEQPIYAVLTEGIDNDDDGAYNEDGPGGVDINSNFLHRYKEHAPEAGPHQLSEPESKALIDFFFDHPRIAAAVFYGRHDNVVEAPEVERSKSEKKAETPQRGGRGMRFMRRRPPRAKAPKDVHKDDSAIYKKISERYREITGLKKVPTEPADGAAYAWAYAQYGIPSFACRVWAIPAPEKDPEPGGSGGDLKMPGENDKDTKAVTPTEDTPRHRRRGGRGSARGKGMPGPDKGEGESADKEAKRQRAWLEYSDKQRGGAGFVPWAPFEHPQLGTVEIGGFAPFFDTTPPPDELDAIARKQLDFVLDLAARLPKLSLALPHVTRLSETVYEIETALLDEGYFPAGLAIAKQNRRVRPVVVRLEVPFEQILGGNRIEKIWQVPGSGGRHRLRWVVLGRPNDRITIRITSEKYGNWSQEVTLAPTTQEDGGS